MRMEPSEEVMYRRMDKKDRMMILMPVSGILAFLGMVLLSAGYSWIFCVILITVALAGMAVSALIYRKTKRLIMPVSGCFLEVEGTCLSVCQPYFDGRYETCHIFLDNVMSVVREKKGGFYLRLCQQSKSSIQDGAGKQRYLMYISPMGYTKEFMETVYQRVKGQLPEKARIYE